MIRTVENNQNLLCRTHFRHAPCDDHLTEHCRIFRNTPVCPPPTALMIVPPFLADFLLPLRAERRRFGAMIDVQLPHNTAPEGEKHNGHKYADQTLSKFNDSPRTQKTNSRTPQPSKPAENDSHIVILENHQRLSGRRHIREHESTKEKIPQTSFHVGGGARLYSQLSVEGHSTEKNVHQMQNAPKIELMNTLPQDPE